MPFCPLPITALTSDDAPALVALQAACFDSGGTWSAESWTTSLNLPTSRGAGIREDDLIRGVILAQVTEDEAEILTLAVHPTARRHGLGAALVRHLVTVFAPNRRIHLEVAADNIAAQGLYERCGFVRSGLRPGYYRRSEGPVDAWLYTSPGSPETPRGS